MAAAAAAAAMCASGVLAMEEGRMHDSGEREVCLAPKEVPAVLQRKHSTMNAFRIEPRLLMSVSPKTLPRGWKALGVVYGRVHTTKCGGKW